MRNITVLLAMILAALSCTRSGPTAVERKPGARIFLFDWKKASRLEILRWNPETNQNWSARLDKDLVGSWSIEVGPDGSKPQDPLAHHKLVEHLMDSLTTLTYRAPAAPGSLESYQLTRPTTALRWESEGHRYELKLGARTPDNQASFAQIGDEAQVIEVNGAALELLTQFNRWDRLRRQTWSVLDLDDIDEVEVYKGKKQLSLYAQRAGTKWEDKNEKPLPSKLDFGTQIEAFTHLQVLSFLDEMGAKERAKLQKELDTAPDFALVFKDRFGNPNRFRVMKKGDRIFGMQSARPSGLVELYPKTLEFFGSVLR